MIADQCPRVFQLAVRTRCLSKLTRIGVSIEFGIAQCFAAVGARNLLFLRACGVEGEIGSLFLSFPGLAGFLCSKHKYLFGLWLPSLALGEVQLEVVDVDFPVSNLALGFSGVLLHVRLTSN